MFLRSFLSFSVDKKQAEKFKGSNADTFSILYEIEEIQNKENVENQISNAIIEDISKSESEKEVLVFPFSCFEIIKIKEIKANDIDYKIKLKYLGNYSKYLKEQFGTNFFDQIQISKFSQELIDSGVLNIENFFSAWIKNEEFKIIMNKICFFLDGQEDFISFRNNEIFVFNIYSRKFKQSIVIHDSKIIDIIKLEFNRICSFSEDKIIKIIKINGNNKRFEVKHVINMETSYAIKLLFLKNENILCFNSETNFLLYELSDNKYIIKKEIQEEDEILIMKEINNDEIMYISENMKRKKVIKFMNLKNDLKDKKYINIEEKNEKLEFIDLLIFYDYIIIAFNYRIDILYLKDKAFKIKSFKYFNFLIKNIMILSSNRIILGYYDTNTGESIIREHLLRIEDLQNNYDKFDCVGQGILESEKIENIIKINEYQILIHIKNKAYAIYERKNEVSEKLKESIKTVDKYVKVGNENEEYHVDNNIKINKISEEKNKVNVANDPSHINNNFKNEINFIQPPPRDRAYELFLNQQLKPINIEQKYDFLNKIEYNNQMAINRNNTFNKNFAKNFCISPTNNPQITKNSNQISTMNSSLEYKNQKNESNEIKNNIKEDEKIINSPNEMKQGEKAHQNIEKNGIQKENDKVFNKNKSKKKLLITG